MSDALVIGAGPAGLMAAQMLAHAGHNVVLAEAMPTVGRKFLMAGKSGLNLTKDAPFEEFMSAFTEAAPALRPALQEFGPMEVREWAQGLGQNVFTGTSGRVFPKTMKTSPLLRAWIVRLVELGVDIRTKWRWTGWVDGPENGAVFETPEGEQILNPKVTVLALGGASWARLGSNGLWTGKIGDAPVAPFQPANMGFVVDWSPHMARHFGAPVKNVILKAGNLRVKGEFVVSSQGLEGGGIYSVSRAMREGADLYVDLLPNLRKNDIREHLKRPRGKNSLSNYLRKVLKLTPAKIALLMEFARPLPDDLSLVLKHLPIRHGGARPMDQAISTAGGIMFDGLDDGLMIRERPGVFVAGEMMDWEAPTGGYLINACLATGRWAGTHAAEFAGD